MGKKGALCLALLSIVLSSLFSCTARPQAPEAGAAPAAAPLSIAAYTAAAKIPGPYPEVVVKNACGAYTELMGLSLLDRSYAAITGAGFTIKSGMDIKVWRIKTYIHYFPGDEAFAEAMRQVLKVGVLQEDPTLKKGLMKVIIGADAVIPLFPEAVGEPSYYIINATGEPETLVRERLADVLPEDVPYRYEDIGKGIFETTVVYCPPDNAEWAGEFTGSARVGESEAVQGLRDTFVILAPDFVGKPWKAVVNWEPDEKEKYSIVIHKKRMIMELIDSRGGVAVEFPIAIGSNPDFADKKKVGDCRTPEGNFTVSNVQPSGDWRYEEELAYGPLYITLETPPWTGIGIHGTNEPYLIGTPISHGCIRMLNENLPKLKKAVGAGTKVTITP